MWKLGNPQIGVCGDKAIEIYQKKEAQ